MTSFVIKSLVIVDMMPLMFKKTYAKSYGLYKIERLENGRRYQPLDEVKSIAGDLKTYLEQKVCIRQHGNIRLSTSEAQKLDSLLSDTGNDTKAFSRLSCN